MKKTTFILTALCLLLGTSAFAQQQKYNHWSLNLKGGLAMPEFGAGNILKDNNARFMLGAELERTFNPLWGIVLDYGYVKYATSNADGAANEVSLLGSVNLLNLLNPYRCGNWQKLNFYSRIGGGLSFYSADRTGTTIVMPITAAMEYDLGKNVAIGLSAERRWHTSSTMGFNNPVQDRAVIWTASANLRIKFGGKKHPHVRNTPMASYQAACAPAKEVVSYDDTPLKQGINNNEGAIKRIQDQLDKTKADVNRLTNELNNAKAALKKCEDANCQTATPNDIKITDFVLNSPVIPTASYGALDQLVETMKKQSSLNVMLTGNTDNSGTELFNEKLSQQRAESVATYLKERGISANRISTKGVADTQPIASNETVDGRKKNRRVDISFSK